MKLIEIKDSLKKQFNFSIICIQSGKFNCFFDEDAVFMSEIFNFNTFEKGKTTVTGFPIWFKKRKYIEYFNENNISYAFLTQYKEVKDKDTQLLKRVITNSSNLDSIGTEFSNQSKFKITEKDEEESHLEIKFLEAVIKGYNPITGELLENDSVWNDPKIQSDIEEYLSDFKISEKISSIDEDDLDGDGLYLLKKLISHIPRINPKISVRDIEIIKCRYGVDGGGRKTLQEVGDKFSISRERVRQIIHKISRRIIKWTKSSEDFKSDSAISFEDSVHYIRDILNKIINANVNIVPDNLTESSFDTSNNEYYQLEKVGSFTPISNQLAESAKLLWQDITYINNLREENRTHNLLLNRGFPLTHEEINLILEYSRQGWSVNKLEKYFQRSYISIMNIIESKKT